MQLKIYKYPLQIAHKFSIETHKVMRFLTVQIQNGQPYLWAVVDTEEELGKIDVVMFGTGTEINVPLYFFKHLGTIQLDGYVWHYFTNADEV